MIQPKDELIRDTKINGIKKQVAECINAAFSKGYETCFEQKKEIEDRAYQKGLEDGKRQGVAIDGDKRYWKGYHAAQEDGKKIYQKGLDDAWDAARKIYAMTANETIAVFGGCSKWVDYSAIEAIEKIRAYEEKQKQEEARSGYVVCDEPIKPEKTVFPDSPCDLCRFKGLGDGKPCTMCPAEGKVEE